MLLLAIGATSCEGEKDLIIIDGNLPIKTSALYLVGDATPNGWSIDDPTPMISSDEDPLVFEWEGVLNTGEMKLCLAKGSWDNPFIRPMVDGDRITRNGVEETQFDMYAGDPDKKWKVADAGVYRLRFDLRNWMMSAVFVREADAPEIEPIETENLYIVGSATPNEWNIDNPTLLEKKSDYVFVYEGALTEGEMKACTEPGSWDVAFVRPSSNGCKIGKNGVEAANFVYTKSPDNKWVVENSGIYRVTFDLSKWTIVAEYLEEFTPAPRLFMIGEATDGGWSWDDATVIESTPENEDIFVWEGTLSRGSLKASPVRDFEAPFYRPSYADCEISESGVASRDMVFTASPDNQWKVVVAGKYRLTFNIADMTFDAVYLDSSVETKMLYMIGEATAGGWSLDQATEIESTPENKDIFIWEGNLAQGALKASLVKDFDAPFYRPSYADCEISESGVASHDMVFTKDPDDKWKVASAGKYRLTFNIADMTFDAVYIGASETRQPLYMIGDATPGGWSLDDAAEYTPVDGSDGEYTWTGELNLGTFKLCTIKDFTAPFYRPSSSDCTVSGAGVSAPDMIYTADPDDKWTVTEKGIYKITVNIKEMTIKAEMQK